MLIILWMKYCLYLRLMMTMSEEDPGIIEDGYQYAKLHHTAMREFQNYIALLRKHTN